MKIRALVVDAKDGPFTVQEQALQDSKSGNVVKPILRMPQ